MYRVVIEVLAGIKPVCIKSKRGSDALDSDDDDDEGIMMMMRNIANNCWSLFIL